MLNWNRSSLRGRITWTASVFATLVCLGVSVLFLIFMGTREANATSTRVSQAAERVQYLIRTGRLQSVLSNAHEEIQVVNHHGHVLAATQHLIGKPAMAGFEPNVGDMRTVRTLCPPKGLEGCTGVLGILVFHPGGNWMIYAAIPGTPWYGSTAMPFVVTAASLLVITMMAAGTSRAVSKTLSPVSAIRTELAEITATDLDHRVPVPSNRDEIRLLAETVNATLDRLESANEQLRQFTSDASHDLRSPITAMRVQVEEGLMYPDDTNWPQTATTVLANMERLQAIVTDLLILARLDACTPLTCTPTDLAQLVGAELDSRNFTVDLITDLREGAWTECDRLRIGRLLTNLLDNAERHANSQITVIVRPEEPMAVLEVIDDGAGVDAESREVVFERFSRLDASRSRDSGGTGLGLAIARQIAEAHKGRLTIEDSERGARFVLRLPHSDPLQASGTGPGHAERT